MAGARRDQPRVRSRPLRWPRVTRRRGGGGGPRACACVDRRRLSLPSPASALRGGERGGGEGGPVSLPRCPGHAPQRDPRPGRPRLLARPARPASDSPTPTPTPTPTPPPPPPAHGPCRCVARPPALSRSLSGRRAASTAERRRPGLSCRRPRAGILRRPRHPCRAAPRRTVRRRLPQRLRGALLRPPTPARPPPPPKEAPGDRFGGRRAPRVGGARPRSGPPAPSFTDPPARAGAAGGPPVHPRRGPTVAPRPRRTPGKDEPEAPAPLFVYVNPGQ